MGDAAGDPKCIVAIRRLMRKLPCEKCWNSYGPGGVPRRECAELPERDQTGNDEQHGGDGEGPIGVFGV